MQSVSWVAYPRLRRRFLPPSLTHSLDCLDCRLPLLAAALTELNLSDNRLAEIPAGILGACRRLHYIDLQQNALAALPDDLAQLDHLREINIAYNK